MGFDEAAIIRLLVLFLRKQGYSEKELRETVEYHKGEQKVSYDAYVDPLLEDPEEVNNNVEGGRRRSRRARKGRKGTRRRR